MFNYFFQTLRFCVKQGTTACYICWTQTHSCTFHCILMWVGAFHSSLFSTKHVSLNSKHTVFKFLYKAQNIRASQFEIPPVSATDLPWGSHWNEREFLAKSQFCLKKDKNIKTRTQVSEFKAHVRETAAKLFGFCSFLRWSSSLLSHSSWTPRLSHTSEIFVIPSLWYVFVL